MSFRPPIVKPKPPVVIKQTLLGYELDSRQNVYVNYLIPSLLAGLFYVFYYACDIVVSYRHFKLDNPIWGSLSVLFMYVPVLGCFIVTISSWELWPELEGCSARNVKWAFLKISQHVFFPIWCMWRYAEKIFWSIEALRTQDEEDRESSLKYVTAPRTIELYLFLQGYLQTVPQIFLQLHILMRYVSGLDGQTMGIQSASILMNFTKMAITTTMYQRFKKQKIGGKNYPWFKDYKFQYCPTIDSVDSPQKRPRSSIIYCTKNNEFKVRESLRLAQVEDLIELQEEAPPVYESESRRSSDFYLEPIAPTPQEQTLTQRQTSAISESEKVVLRSEDLVDIPRRVIDITALPEDDIAGKFVSFLWWFCFLVARLLAISSFAYFYPVEILWVLGCHFTITIAFLLYDAQALEVRRRKAIFFIFVGLVYLFCLIEFKIKFKKAKFWYYGFFTLTYLENFVMTLVWYFLNLEFIISDDWWFKYIFYVIISGSSLSLLSMITYLKVDKPKSVAVEEQHVSVLFETATKRSFIKSILKPPGQL